MLEAFEIIEARHLSDDPEIACRDGKVRVLAHVAGTAWEDVFGLDRGIELSTIDGNLLAGANLGVLKRLIEAKYARGETTPLARAGSTLPLVQIGYDDLAPYRAELSAEVLKTARKAAFQARR